MIPDAGATVDRAVARALDAYAGLVELGEEIEDEWTYIDDLATAWRDRLDAVAAERHGEHLEESLVVAIETAAAEALRITEPHRAIDWLSTFPQIVLVALEEQA